MKKETAAAISKDNTLTGKVFRVTITSYFVANIMTVLGTVIDGFVVGNMMDASYKAAIGLVSPAVILFSVIGTIAGISFQVRSVRCLSGGDVDGAHRALAETLALGLGLSALLMVIALFYPGAMVRWIGVHKNSDLYYMCIDYLRGTAAGLPAMTAMAILTRGVQIEGSPKIAVRSVTVMAAMNALGDIICAAIPGADLLGITIVTSISYYAGVAVLLQYYRKPDVLLKPSIKGLSFKETLVVNNIGVWGGVIGLISGLTLVLRADILNIAIDLLNVENTGLQAYSTQVQLNYIVNAFQNSAISIMFLLGAVCKAEEDRVSFKRIMAQIIKYDVISATVISIVVYCFADGLAWLYLGNAGKEVLGTSAGVLRACAVGIVFQMVVLLFANYLQVFGHNILAILIIITSNVFVPLFGASYGAEIAKLLSANIVVGVFGGLAALHVISALLLPLLIPVVNRRFHGRDLIWMMPENFGTLPENELRAVITKQSEVVKFSQQAWDFCIDKGEPQRIAYLTALAIEEMAMNVLEHGFDEDGRKHILSIRLVNKEDELILRFRDDTPRLDPREEYESVFNKEDESRMIGLKMIMEEAKDVRYTSMLHLNNLVIRIDTRL